MCCYLRFQNYPDKCGTRATVFLDGRSQHGFLFRDSFGRRQLRDKRNSCKNKRLRKRQNVTFSVVSRKKIFFFQKIIRIYYLQSAQNQVRII